MVEGILSWVCIALFIFGNFNPEYLIASAAFAIASQLELNREKEDWYLYITEYPNQYLAMSVNLMKRST